MYLHPRAHIVKIWAGRTESLSNSPHWLESQTEEHKLLLISNSAFNHLDLMADCLPCVREFKWFLLGRASLFNLNSELCKTHYSNLILFFLYVLIMTVIYCLTLNNGLLVCVVSKCNCPPQDVCQVLSFRFLTVAF